MSELNPPAPAIEEPRPAPEGPKSAIIVARAAQDETQQVLAQIMKVILDKRIPDTRVELLLARHKELVADQRRLLFVDAMAAVQPQLPTIDRNGRVVVYSKAVRAEAERNQGEIPPGAVPVRETPYALQEDIVEAVRGPLGEHGLILSFEPSQTPEKRIAMRAVLSHVGGHVHAIDVPSIEVDTSGGKNNVQGMGSSLKYLMRYGTILILNIVSRDPRDGIDNDGANGKKVGDFIAPLQLDALAKEVASQGGKCLEQILAAFNIDKLADLPAAKFAECTLRLSERRAAAARAKGVATP